jgi:hypothetical protein
MARCPECNAKVAWDATACIECHVIFDDSVGWTPIGEDTEETTKLNRLRPIRSPALVTEIEAAAQPSDLSALNTILAIGFGILALIWLPLTLVTPLMFDHPGAGGFPVYLLIFAILIYGPVYFFALVKTTSLMKRTRHREAIHTWLRLCGGNVLLGLFARILLEIFCSGTFVCKGF